MFSVVQEMLRCNYPDIDNAVVKEVVCAVTGSNMFLKYTSTGGSLSTSNRRVTYVAKEFPVVEPVEFFTDK